MTKNVWTHGCDACGANAPVEYVTVLGYLCAPCRRPESIEDLKRELREAWQTGATPDDAEAKP